nr:hypothetical protein [Sulfurospirillum sp. 'SP']
MKSLRSLGIAALCSVGAFAAGNVTVPTPDYTDFYSIVGVGLGVTLVVMLARKGKSFLSK